MLHVNTRINIALISDFLAKLMRLPLHFFDTKMVGISCSASETMTASRLS